MIMKCDNLLKIKELEHEQLQFDTFSNKKALEIGLRLVEIAEKKQYPITIDIRKNSQQIFHYACEGTSADNDQWVIRKNRVVNRFGKSSSYIKALVREQESSLEKMFCLNSRQFSAFGGAFPLILKNTGSVGTITVSGLPDEEDHDLVVSVLKEFLN